MESTNNVADRGLLNLEILTHGTIRALTRIECTNHLAPQSFSALRLEKVVRTNELQSEQED